MKLKTKLLLPLLGIGSVAAATTPLVVSCGSSSSVDYEIYTPTIEQARWNGRAYSADSGAELYANHIKQNPEIFKQDMRHFLSLSNAFSIHEFWFAWGNDAPLTFKMNGSISNFSCEYIPYLYSNNIVLTYDFTGSIDIDCYWNAIRLNKFYEGEYTVQKIKIPKFTVHFEKVPFSMEAVGGYQTLWSIYPNFSAATGDLALIFPWSIKVEIPNGKITYIDDDEDYTIQEYHTYSYKNDVYFYDNFTGVTPYDQKEAVMAQLCFKVGANIGKIYHMDKIVHGYL